MKKIIFLSYLFFASLTVGRAQEVSLAYPEFQWNAGITVSPQMLFVGALDLGAFLNIETSPVDNPFTILAGIDLRNKWVQLPLNNQGLDTRSIQSNFGVHLISYAGLGYSLLRAKNRNSFYLTATPYYFGFKETVNTPFLNNAVERGSVSFNAGITWTNTEVTKKGRVRTTQFYLPLAGSHILDELRVMNLKFGWTF
ncbi:MAG: hypothetical protein AAGH79_17545 [Bacteroidota bacterium]